jgi:oligoendopeptidase F
MQKTDLDIIRQRSESLFQELEQEFYLEGAGLKDEVNAAVIYEKYPELSDRSTVESIQLYLSAPQKKSASTAEDRKKLKLLLENSVQMYLNKQVQPMNDKMLTIESNGSILVNGKEIGFRQSAVSLVNETDREVRQAISDRRDEFIEEELNPLLLKIHAKTESGAKSIGFKNYVAMVEQLSGIELYSLHELTEEFLRSSNELYEENLRRHAKKKLSLALENLRKHDLAFLARAKEHDVLFSGGTISERIFGIIRSMGLDPTAGGKIRLDLESRPKKSPRAFCSPVRIPDEIYLVISPAGGADDYSAFLHELGHALHFGNADPRMDWEYKRLGDNSVTEAFAFTFDHLLLQEVFLKKGLGISKPQTFLRQKALTELMMLRRYCAKLSYELVLHDGRPIKGKQQVYREFLSNATRAEYSEEQYLADVDGFFYCARYLRAWMLQSALAQHLKENYDEDWFMNPKCSEFLIDLWSVGQKYSAEEFARHIGYNTLNFEAILDSLEGMLG